MQGKLTQMAEHASGVRSAAELDRLQNDIVGCLLGGAIGDALSEPVWFMERHEIVEKYGAAGLRDYAPDYGRPGAITHKTFMGLFIAEGLIRSHLFRGPEATNAGPHALVKTLRFFMHFQSIDLGDRSPELSSWRIANVPMQRQRNPLSACLQSIDCCKSIDSNMLPDRSICESLTMIAPLGAYAATRNRSGGPGRSTHSTFENGTRVAEMLPGRLSAGFLAALIEAILRGDSVDCAIERSLAEIKKHPMHEPIASAIETARELDRLAPYDPDAAQALGNGQCPHDTLAISLYYALSARDFESGMIMAVNHGGRFDAIGAVVGNILGAVCGAAAIPERWLFQLEAGSIIRSLATDLSTLPVWSFTEKRDPRWNRYISVTDFHFDSDSNDDERDQ